MTAAAGDPDPVPGAVLPVPPLNLPVGSVRALITLGVLGTVWAQLLRVIHPPPGSVLHDTVILVLGYYFGARAAKAPAADALTAPGDREANPADPLYLPRGSIRLLIVLGFAAVVWQLHRTGRLLGADGNPPAILMLVGTFLGGGILKGALGLVGSGIGQGFMNAVGHLFAGATLVVVLGYCGLILGGLEATAPTWSAPVFLGVVGFYLGKR